MKKYFIAGLVTLLPLALTVWVALFLLDFLTKPFVGFTTRLMGEIPIPPQLIRYLSEVAILIVFFIFILLLGLVARWYFFHSLLKIGERILNRIPLYHFFSIF